MIAQPCQRDASAETLALAAVADTDVDVHVVCKDNHFSACK